MFLQVSVILSTGGGMCGCSGGHAWLLWGACMVAPRGHAWLLRGGHAWLLPGGCAWLLWGACMVALGGMHGCSGGHAWLLRGACMVAPGGCMVAPGGMHGCSRGHAWLLGGACVVFSMRYGQWAGGTHPTGMHSCLWILLYSFHFRAYCNILGLLLKLFRKRSLDWIFSRYILDGDDVVEIN